MCVRVGTETTGSLKYRVDDLQEPDHLTTCTCVLGGNREVGVSCILTETEKGKEKIKIATATKRKGGIKRLKDSKVKEEIGKEGKKNRSPSTSWYVDDDDPLSRVSAGCL